MKRLVIFTFTAAVVIVAVWYCRGRVGNNTQSIPPVKPLGASPNSSPPILVAASPSINAVHGIEPQTSSLLTTGQWQAFLAASENERSFQEFRGTTEFTSGLNELQSIGSSAQGRGELSENEVERVRFYLHHRYYGFRDVALQLAEKVAKSDTTKEALFPDISALLRDVVPTVRRGAIQALVAIKGSQAIPLLKERLGDPELTVRARAQQAIQSLSATSASH